MLDQALYRVSSQMPELIRNILHWPGLSRPARLTCSEAGRVQRLGQLLQFLLPAQENEVSLILLHQVHLVDETENFGLKLELLERI